VFEFFVAIDGCGGVPPIRPLETLHNALSLRQLDAFLERMTTAPFRTPPSCASPPKLPGNLPRLPNDLQSPSNSSESTFFSTFDLVDEKSGFMQPAGHACTGVA
jgi:inositol-hexakisphosphate/diphosphoinositol-pentakisphosphate 1-kinase